ncbi:hypothetical protein TraAM80_08362 [Trypanosoma rangeli]|uniref:Choline transporter-like protein n=1 Tax=Trypanosoma rangeli TaxID=5698 RepID=A0A3R7MAJ2_TRYRA|nr:uncharacterized protein TraAM80_08362 [Trypanosoma rangeli]RNE99135.1 hypothetical protein TraAM80_08362 [Trypanosoma rangeli]|eukprot:RNE99135.1 hypothetical protein TraAM80_08362 [Trypanosoma rangeli]
MSQLAPVPEGSRAAAAAAAAEVEVKEEEENLVAAAVQGEHKKYCAEEVDKDAKSDVNGSTWRLQQQQCGWQDTWALVTFLLVVGVSAAWGMTFALTGELTESLQQLVEQLGADVLGRVTTAQVFVGFAMGVSTAGVCTAVVVLLLELAPTAAIVLSALLFSAVLLLLSVVAFDQAIVPIGATLALMGLLQVCWLCAVRSRIAFSAQLLAAASAVMQQFPALLCIPALLMIAFFGHLLWGVLVLHAAAKRMQRGDLAWMDGGLAATSVFSIVWVANLVSGVSRVTTGGVVGTRYFASSENLPHAPTWASFKRATTTSFGSVCLGALLNTVVSLLGWVCRLSLNTGSEFIDCCLVCVLSLLGCLVAYCNFYVYVQVALYGCGYVASARRTWRLWQKCACSAAFNDALVSTTLRVLEVGLAGVVAAVLACSVRSVALEVIVFLIFLFSLTCVLRVVSEVVHTLFVGFAELPDRLAASFPDLHAALMASDDNFAAIHAHQRCAVPV